MKHINHIITMFVLCSIFHNQSSGHGFGADTPVTLLLSYKTAICGKVVKQQMETVQTLKDIYENPITRKTKAKSYDEQSHAVDYKSIKAAGISAANCYVRIEFNNDSDNIIECSPIQTFYLIDSGQWVSADQLELGDILFSENPQGTYVSRITVIEKPLRLYTLEIKRFHTFLVGKDKILTHNIFLLPNLFLSLSLSFGEGALVGASTGSSFGPLTMGAGLALGGVINIITACISQDNKKIEYHVEFDVNQLARNGNIKKPKKTTTSSDSGSGSNDKDPDDPDKKNKKVVVPFTNKQNREDAKKLGYTEDKNPPFYAHGELAFKKGNSWITADNTQHNGGRWKMFDREGRIGTYDKNLNYIKD